IKQLRQKVENSILIPQPFIQLSLYRYYLVKIPNSANVAGFPSVVRRALSRIYLAVITSKRIACSTGLFLILENSPRATSFQFLPSRLTERAYSATCPLG